MLFQNTGNREREYLFRKWQNEKIQEVRITKIPSRGFSSSLIQPYIYRPTFLGAFALSFSRVIFPVSHTTVVVISEVTKFAQQLCVSPLQSRHKQHIAPVLSSRMSSDAISAQHSTFWCPQHSTDPNPLFREVTRFCHFKSFFYCSIFAMISPVYKSVLFYKFSS